MHYYFRRKPDLLVALVERLPREHLDHSHIVVRGDVAGSLRRLVAALDAWLDASPVLSHLLWREADTHHVVRDALTARFRWMVDEIRAVMRAALPESRHGATVHSADVHSADVLHSADVHSAAELLALAVSYRHSMARHAGDGLAIEPPLSMHRELDFLAEALAPGTDTAH